MIKNIKEAVIIMNKKKKVMCEKKSIANIQQAMLFQYNIWKILS